MALPTGTISLSQVNVELGLSSTATISLNDADVRNLAGVSTGAISMDDLRGKSAIQPIIISAHFYSGPFQYFWGADSSNFLPGGPLGEFQYWVVYNYQDSIDPESFTAYSRDTLTIDNFGGGDSVDTTNVWSRLIKIDVMGTDGSVLGSYDKSNFIVFPRTYTSGNAYAIPMQSLGLFDAAGNILQPYTDAFQSPLTDANYTSFDPTGKLYLNWYFTP